MGRTVHFVSDNPPESWPNRFDTGRPYWGKRDDLSTWVMSTPNETSLLEDDGRWNHPTLNLWKSPDAPEPMLNCSLVLLSLPPRDRPVFHCLFRLLSVARGHDLAFIISFLFLRKQSFNSRQGMWLLPIFYQPWAWLSLQWWIIAAHAPGVTLSNSNPIGMSVFIQALEIFMNIGYLLRYVV